MGVGRRDGGLAYLAVFANADLAKEDLVEHSAAEVAGVQVGLYGSLYEREGVLEGLADVCDLNVGSSEQLIDGLFLGLDAVGLAAQHVL